MATPEARVRAPVIRWAKANGFLHFRLSFRPGVARGLPDDLFVTPFGVHVWAEFKRPGKCPTELQMTRLVRLQERGVAAFWCDAPADGIAALQRLRDLETELLVRGAE
jgi:hypothetical protein